MQSHLVGRLVRAQARLWSIPSEGRMADAAARGCLRSDWRHRALSLCAHEDQHWLEKREKAGNFGHSLGRQIPFMRIDETLHHRVSGPLRGYCGHRRRPVACEHGGTGPNLRPVAAASAPGDAGCSSMMDAPKTAINPALPIADALTRQAHLRADRRAVAVPLFHRQAGLPWLHRALRRRAPVVAWPTWILQGGPSCPPPPLLHTLHATCLCSHSVRPPFVDTWKQKTIPACSSAPQTHRHVPNAPASFGGWGGAGLLGKHPTCHSSFSLSQPLPPPRYP